MIMCDESEMYQDEDEDDCRKKILNIFLKSKINKRNIRSDLFLKKKESEIRPIQTNNLWPHILIGKNPNHFYHIIKEGENNDG